MNATELLLDAYGRIREQVHAAVKGVHPEELAHRPTPHSNSIAWLIWHLTRVQDDHIADVAELEQVWTADGWFERFDLPFDPSATGYGQSPAEVASVQVESGALLTGYFDAVYDQTIAFLRTLNDHDLDRVVDTNWDPPVTLGVRLVSVLDDDLEHVGQAAFVRGMLKEQ
ncbi:DinB family protein [Microlunatus panaciterrae]|uniref:Damage-inducible protein DinB n=1 Tax=Microlunatus panaciterrae TaxID=400768 RepID=A0ABS2RJM9_9ACTN|nr:DinB family protein [Microlunatus panaciterrae]MBM7798169.1 putative damage-inducible protein DinB [Microlunatus panaciterrae]